MNTVENNARWHPSVTVAAVIEQSGKFLLVEEHTREGLKLNQPAGHLDLGESLIQACVRETLEETARAFAPTAWLGTYMSRMQRPSTQEDITYLRFAFCGQVGEPIVGRELDKEIVRTLWLSYEEIVASQDRHRSPLLLRCVEDFVRGQCYSLDSLWTDASVSLSKA